MDTTATSHVCLRLPNCKCSPSSPGDLEGINQTDLLHYACGFGSQVGTSSDTCLVRVWRYNKSSSNQSFQSCKLTALTYYYQAYCIQCILQHCCYPSWVTKLPLSEGWPRTHVCIVVYPWHHFIWRQVTCAVTSVHAAAGKTPQWPQLQTVSSWQVAQVKCYDSLPEVAGQLQPGSQGSCIEQ